MKFKFKLEQVLKYRRLKRDIAQRDFSQVQAKFDEAKGKLQSLYEKLDETRQWKQQLQEKGGECLFLIGEGNEYLVGSQAKVSHQKEEIRKIQHDLEEAHAQLVEENKEHKTIEKLKSRSKRRFEDAQRKAEIKEIDEMVTTRFKKEQP